MEGTRWEDEVIVGRKGRKRWLEAGIRRQMIITAKNTKILKSFKISQNIACVNTPTLV